MSREIDQENINTIAKLQKQVAVYRGQRDSEGDRAHKLERELSRVRQAVIEALLNPRVRQAIRGAGAGGFTVFTLLESVVPVVSLSPQQAEKYGEILRQEKTDRVEYTDLAKSDLR